MNKINENNEIKINVDPLNLFIPNKVLNSLCSLFKIKFQKIYWRLGIIQNEYGINNKPKKVLNQFKGKLKIFVEGSKIEKRFVIIFNKNFFYDFY